MGHWIFLSYAVSEETPVYGGGSGFSCQRDKKMEAGGSCNTQVWQTPNHIGTHVDAPRHFSENGWTIDDYQADKWIFYHPFVIDISLVAHETLITPKQVDLGSVPPETDILLLMTGFSRYRGYVEYWRNGPGISPDVADAIRGNLPSVRALGVDLISVSSLAHRESGRKAHRAFLDHPDPILLIEDMDLSQITGCCLDMVIAAPFRAAGADGTPCTIMALCNKPSESTAGGEKN